jgi:hypothetical protein
MLERINWLNRLDTISGSSLDSSSDDFNHSLGSISALISIILDQFCNRFLTIDVWNQFAIYFGIIFGISIWEFMCGSIRYHISTLFGITFWMNLFEVDFGRLLVLPVFGITLSGSFWGLFLHDFGQFSAIIRHNWDWIISDHFGIISISFGTHSGSFWIGR